MQANHNQTFEQFKNNYKNILGISIKQASADFCNND
jgi:hypothetical protein